LNALADTGRLPIVREDSLLSRLSSLLADVTGASPEALGPASAPGNTPGWDSVANLGFLAAVEEEFGIGILTAEAMGLQNLGDMERLVRAKLSAPPA
jgi:acyl carrier protein